jgi:hypothetical protein
MGRRFLAVSGAIIVTLVLAIGVVYAFGTPQAPPPSAMPLSANGAPAEATPQVAQGEVPAPDPKTPLAIQIPGCKCHSDDPQIVEEHSKYRMNQCGGCHGGKTPTGQ